MNKRFMETRGYVFKSNLGEGMSGKVVRADSIKLKKPVAIKVIDKKKANYSEKFTSREVEIVKSLNHPNVVKTLEIFQSHTNMVYVVMELCVNGDLLNYINAHGALSEQLGCRLFVQLCEAVQYLHNRDVVHRDLKCENLLLDASHNLKVGDFGFSKRLTYTGGKMVLSETFCGTLSYAAPELLCSHRYNPKVSDVWSMGIVLYMMLYASVPYETSNITRMVQLQRKHNINFPGSVTVSSEAKDLIRGILQPAVEKRITISSILQSSWILLGGKMEDGEKASTSNADSPLEGPPDEKANEDRDLLKDNTDPGEGPSTSEQR